MGKFALNFHNLIEDLPHAIFILHLFYFMMLLSKILFLFYTSPIMGFKYILFNKVYKKLKYKTLQLTNHTNQE